MMDNIISEKICILCKEVYEFHDITYEQRIIAYENFSPICGHREIMAFTDSYIDFSFMEGLAKSS